MTKMTVSGKKNAAALNGAQVKPNIEKNLESVSDEEFKKYLSSKNGGGDFGKETAGGEAEPIDDAALLERIKTAAARFFPESGNPCNELLTRLESEDYSVQKEDADKNSDVDGRQKILGRWKRDCERLKKEVPDFDLNTAMKNSLFRNLVVNGMSIDGAYYAVKYKENAAAPKRRAIMQNASSKGTRSGSGANDLTSLSDKDFQKEIRKLMY